MVCRELRIINSEDFKARAASLLVQTASRYASRISIERGNLVVNAKSMMGVLSMGAARGEKLIMVFEGEDEQAAADVLEKMVSSGFAELTRG